MSPKRAAELTQTMYQISFRLATDPQLHRVLLQMDDEQRLLYNLLLLIGCPISELRNGQTLPPSVKPHV
jgi:hypothetical protein